MNMLQELSKLKIKNLYENQNKFEFPIYMRLIRKTIGFSRKFVADSIGCSETKISYMEKGDYGMRGPDYEFIVTIALFYGLDTSATLKKFRCYMKDRKDKKKEEIPYKNLTVYAA